MTHRASSPPDRTPRPAPEPGTPRRAERGQVLAIFVGGIVLFMLLLAVVLDVSWYYANTLRVQRAADAAALAGAVYLPGDRTTAFANARAEARKNGYIDGTNAVVTPSQNATNPRQLDVTIAADVGTYFMRVIGISSIRASRTSKAEYVLPVPMGSPQNYYGIGFYQGVVPGTTTTVNGDTGWLPVTATKGTNPWTSATNAAAPTPAPNTTPGAGSNNLYATTTSSGTATRGAWGDVGLSFPAGATILGIEVGFEASRTGTSATCTLRVDLSYNNGSNYTSGSGTGLKTTAALVSSDPVAPYLVVGTATDLWGRASWATGDFTNTNLRVRVYNVTATNCGTVRMDLIRVRVSYSTTVTTPTTYPVLSVPDPAGGTLPTQGFWGAIFTSGGIRENGDRYAPEYIGGNNPPDGTNGGPNPDYDVNGYDYTVEVGASGEVRLFDPIFCATGANLSGGWFGTGDHWTNDGTGGGTTLGPVAARFRLYDTAGTPYTTSDDTQVGSDLTYDPGTRTLGDLSGSFGTPQNNTDPNRLDCATNAAHNRWVAPGGWNGLPAGTYRLNVNTSFDAENRTLGAENLFSIWVTGSGRARVYGGGRMAAYTNLDDTGAGGAQTFYFSQIEDVHAGKTMVITLFDPGEANADSYLRFLSPYGGSYNYATFNWSSNDGRSGTNVTQIQTATNSGALFNNRILTIEIPLPADYGTGGLDPNGLGEDGWWLVEYDVRAANDTTTWEVEIRGNPVHLKVP
jgi:Flp pilus assembly protein TadG